LLHSAKRLISKDALESSNGGSHSPPKVSSPTQSSPSPSSSQISGSIHKFTIPPPCPFTISYFDLIEYELNKLKKKLLSSSYTKNGKDLSTLFDRLDVDHSGSLDVDELSRVITRLVPEISNRQLIELLRLIDSDGNGTIEKDELILFLNDGRPWAPPSPTKIFKGSKDAIENAKRMLNQPHHRLTGRLHKNVKISSVIYCVYYSLVL